MDTGIENTKILIGDDSQILNNMLRDVFEEEGFEVVQAYDGFQCKSMFLKEIPDITFLDAHMPEADGIEVLRFIKKKSPDTVVVMMTAIGMEDIAVEAMKLGANDCIHKPFRTDEVVELARRLLENRRAARETGRLKKEVRRGEKYLAHLTSIINEALITTDARGRIEFVNRAAAQMWGYTPEELHGKDVHFLIRGESSTLLYRDLVKDTIKQGRIEGEFHLRKKDKGTFPGYLSSSVIRDGDRLRGIVIVVADLTRLYEVERRLKQSEKLASLGKVVEGIAHEVRNCLTSLGGFAFRLRKITADIPDCDHFTRIILGDVARLETMVREIEEYVRFSKFYSFQFRKVGILEFIDRAHARVRSEIPEDAFRSISFNIRSEKDVPAISGDPAALEEIFFNLILNAYEAMPSGGKLKVTVRNRTSAISVAIADTGTGMRKDDVPEIFNPFVTTKTSGAGMGLSKVYLLVEEHRGSVKVTSELGKGSTFEVFLPLERLMTGLRSWESAAGGQPA
jgi:PAS domain S-box-containing protein